jgi:X-Pro dipeptidyl-peptidase
VNPCERVEHDQRAFLPDPVYDKFWRERDYLSRISNVRASVMIEGSWVDGNVHPINSIEMWSALPANYPKKLVMAQQGHGDANLPDSVDIRHAWFDYWLLGLDTGVMDLPSVDSFVNNGVRFQDAKWPPAGTRTKRVVLSDKDGIDTLGLVDGPEAVWVDNNPALTDGDAMRGGGGTADVVFEGRPVEDSVRIAGTAVLDADVVTSAENTWLTPVLFSDLNGTTDIITTGMLNARNRFGLRKSVPLEPGKPWRARVKFQPVDYVVPAGARIGLALMSMNKTEALYWSGSLATNELPMESNENRLLLPIAPLS